jgi:hypothetical protein
MNDLNDLSILQQKPRNSKNNRPKKTLKEAYRQLAWAFENTNQLNLAEEDYKQIINITKRD